METFQSHLVKPWGIAFCCCPKYSHRNHQRRPSGSHRSRVHWNEEKTLENGFGIQIGDIYSEERKDIMIRIKIPSLKSPTNSHPLLNLQLSYFDILSAACVMEKSTICVERPKRTPRARGIVTDQDFLDQRLRIDMANTFDRIIEYGNSGNLNDARQQIAVMIKRVEQHPLSMIIESTLSDLEETREALQSHRVI